MDEIRTTTAREAKKSTEVEPISPHRFDDCPAICACRNLGFDTGHCVTGSRPPDIEELQGCIANLMILFSRVLDQKGPVDAP